MDSQNAADSCHDFDPGRNASMKCRPCEGTGKMKCVPCSGEGFEYGRKKCDHCDGVGLVTCSECGGTGKVGFMKWLKSG